MASNGFEHTAVQTSSDLHPLFAALNESNMGPAQSERANDPVHVGGEQSRLSMDTRREVIMRVFGEADSSFISQYVKCLVDFGLTHIDFIAGEVTDVFEKRHGALSTHEMKALGGLFIQLQRKGVIEKTGGYRARNQGNASAIYKLKNV